MADSGEPAPKKPKVDRKDAPPRELVSFIVPAHNASSTIDECLDSICKITYRPLEVAVYDDASTDDTFDKLQAWVPKCAAAGVTLHAIGKKKDTPGGAGYAKNRAAEACTGTYFAFLDSDDITLPHRVNVQIAIAKQDPAVIVGANFTRIPEGSTWHYTAWANSLTDEQLVLQQYRECTIIMPTWFMSRERFTFVGGFDEAKTSATIPEDLIFFLKHLELGGTLKKAADALVIYRHSSGSVCSKLPRRVLLRTRLESLERRVLSTWPSFTIWGCGRDGKAVFNELSIESKRKVAAFCDVNEKKIGTKHHDQVTRLNIPIIHFSEAVPPIICCVSMGRTDGELEANVRSLNLTEGVNFWHFI
ncbi:hypothetical protein H310_11005 [Aphanomyces invadans]|uniref:Glycosyltransferase 2-like domain-containing protein n=1 Tax=Aphanomyces invadans TaxID=157072 RepID=A0A024TNI5_9STRA|nr:hypothetical protein H310_11005 [Aphanomyces invadans]ETV95564.1 hypothetical protein H310_11005 [Aphanomyces invadans]|eukprot:XP_008875757.1 hypothetical protein H310_11005 [Aphanomyces invadans]